MLLGSVEDELCSSCSQNEYGLASVSSLCKSYLPDRHTSEEENPKGDAKVVDRQTQSYFVPREYY